MLGSAPCPTWPTSGPSFASTSSAPCRPPGAISASPPPSPPPASPISSATSACASSTAPPAACSRPSRARSSTRARGKILDTIAEAEAAVAEVSQNPRGSLHVAAPLGLGKRLIAPLVPAFNDLYPEIDVRLRLSDRRVDITAEALDLAFHLGPLEDSTLRVRPIAECPRLLAAAPAYLATHPRPRTGDDLRSQRHACLLHRYPGAREFYWTLATPAGPQRFDVSGPLESDDGDVLTAWAIAGRGIILKPAFEIAEHLASGALVPVCEDTPPLPVSLACLYPSKRLQDPKSRLFIDFMVAALKRDLARILAAPAA